MLKNNSVIFKGRKDGIIIALDDKSDFDVIQETLRKKVSDAERFFGDAKTVITFKGRALTRDEEQALVKIIDESSRLKILGAVSEEYIDDAKPKPKADEITILDDKVIKPNENEYMTRFHRGGLRSGQSIRFAGSVVLIGDVNPGAEIVAEGNVIVMGVIKGMVHAGCSGDSKCYVAALNMQPIQLRIADVIIYVPMDIIKENKKKLNPVYAFISEGQIYIAPIGNLYN